MGMPHHLSILKNNYKNSRKIYYNPLRVINEEFSQHADLSDHLSPLTNNSKNYRKMYFFCKVVPHL
jgi:hypothetical protein